MSPGWSTKLIPTEKASAATTATSTWEATSELRILPFVRRVQEISESGQRRLTYGSTAIYAAHIIAAPSAYSLIAANAPANECASVGGTMCDEASVHPPILSSSAAPEIAVAPRRSLRPNCKFLQAAKPPEIVSSTNISAAITNGAAPTEAEESG